MHFFARLFGTHERSKEHAPPVFFTDTLSGSKKRFIPLKPGVVSMYTCGPTVYSRQHIGNLRPGIVADTIARVLAGAGYRVRRVLNITDVGHLVGDGDQGEDKVAEGARREHTTPEKIAKRYADAFVADLGEVGVPVEDIRFPRATEYVREQIALAKTLEEKGFAYRTKDGLYFDTARFPSYGRLGNVGRAELVAGKRVGMGDKRGANDFALWRAAKPNDLQQWQSPWGSGNPGWHLECSAMARVLLGTELDIHTGGEDLAMIHHNDEIAQSEAASGRTFVRYWLHNAFLTMGGEKVSKSLGNVIYLSDIAEKGFHPLALRYFFLQAHYRTPLSFSWDALAAADETLRRLWTRALEVQDESDGKAAHSDVRDRFLAHMRDDLATPQALGVLWESLRSEDYTPEELFDLLETADAHLGLSLLTPPKIVRKFTAADAPEDVRALAEARDAARDAKDYAKADSLRKEIEKSGYRVEDGASGTVLAKRR